MTELLENRVIGFLGLCMRAGRIISGQEACVDLVRRDAAALVLLDAGASENTHKRIADACHSHGVPMWCLREGALGQAIGKRGRMVIALEAGGMAQNLLSMLDEEPKLSIVKPQERFHISK